MGATLRCFDDAVLNRELDKDPFKFKHKLIGHPSMDMSNLVKVIPSLPTDQVYYSSGKLDKGANFARTYLDNQNGLSIEETINSMKTVDSFIMVRGPESDPSFKELFAELCADVKVWLKACGLGDEMMDPMFYMFVASPGSVTPFHIDRISTILMQFQGNKTITVYPAWDERTVTAETLEGFMVRTGARPVYDPSFEGLGKPYDFGPGESIHMPFVAPHDVKNGTDDVSISLSITFHTSHSEKLKDAMFMNQLIRKRLKMKPKAVGGDAKLDYKKADMYGSYRKLRRIFTKE